MHGIFPTALLLLISTVAMADSILPGDVTKGAALHKKDCTACHGTEVYTRKDRKIGTTGGLIQRVRMCQGAVGKQYQEAEIENLVKYLNDSFYKFEK